MRRRHDHGPRETSHGIDLAPMLDFVVNLLIFFIITAVFVKESGVAVGRPTRSGDDAAPAKDIRILKDGDILIEDREVDVRLVRANIEKMGAVDDVAGILILATVR